MAQVAQYAILFDEDTEGLAKKVNEVIKQGGQPYGELKIETRNDGNRIFLQVVVKYKQE